MIATALWHQLFENKKRCMNKSSVPPYTTKEHQDNTEGMRDDSASITSSDYDRREGGWDWETDTKLEELPDFLGVSSTNDMF